MISAIQPDDPRDQIFSNSFYVVYAGDGQQFSTNAPGGGYGTFSNSNPGIYYPYASGVTFVGEDGIYAPCSLCLGVSTGRVDGPAITVATVPESATWAMLLLGFAGLGFAFRQPQ
jgi:hypothetical protein